MLHCRRSHMHTLAFIAVTNLKKQRPNSGFKERQPEKSMLLLVNTENNRVARAARISVHFFDIVCQMTA